MYHCSFQIDLSLDEVGVGFFNLGFIMAFVLIMIIYLMVIMYGSHTLTAVIEEKSSRMVEVLLASISPGDLMLGKVMGIGLACGVVLVGVTVLMLRVAIQRDWLSPTWTKVIVIALAFTCWNGPPGCSARSTWPTSCCGCCSRTRR